jgi:hypothetical protein
MPVEILIAVLVVAVVVVAVPIRRLLLDGHSGWAIVGYCALLGLLALGVTEARTLGRILLPLLGLVYIAPFITLGGGLDRLLGRRRPDVRVMPAPTRAIEPPRDVTPRDVTPPAGAETTGVPSPDPTVRDEPTGRHERTGRDEPTGRPGPGDPSGPSS